MAYGLYEIDKQDIRYKRIKPKSDYKDIGISKINPRLAGSFVRAFYWNLLTAGKGKIYYILNESGEYIHTSYVIPRCSKFPFLRKGYHDIEIGPCMTDEGFRGQGLYPYVLSKIVEAELGEKDKAFMIVDDGNKPSIRGIMKAGFRRCGNIEKTRVLKRYKVMKTK